MSPIPPPAGGRPDSGGEDPAALLGHIFGQETASATAEQRAAARRWQGKDRYYEQVQRAMNDPNVAAEARSVALDLADLARPLSADVHVWRGIRSVDRTFGVGLNELARRVGHVLIVQRFLSTTVYPHVALEEFTAPATSPAMLNITAKTGVRAVWMPPLGEPGNAYQGELLFAPGVRMRILSVDTSAEMPVIEVEVSQP